MKRYIKILFIVIISLMIFNGCGDNSNNSNSSNSSNNSEDSNSSNNSEDSNNPNLSNGSGDSSNPNPSNASGDSNNPNPSNASGDSNSLNNNKEFYGNWKYIDDGRVQKIDGNFAYPIKRLGANFIEINKDGTKQMLLRDGSNKAIVRGQIYNLVKTIQKIDKVTQEKTTHYIPILKTSKKIKNLRVTIDDGFTRETKRVDGDGKFIFLKFNIGDIGVIIDGEEEEEIESDINKTSRVILFEENLTVNSEDTDLGNFYLPDVATNDSNTNELMETTTPTHNFKTIKVLDIQDEDDRYMYENRTYKGKLVFKNTGDTMATALNYIITTNDPYVESITHDIVMGSVDVNQSVEIPFEVTFRMLDQIKHRVKLDFIIRDVNGNEWLDNAYLDVYQTPVWVNVKTKSSKLKGYFVTPEHEVIDIDTSDIKVKLPVRPDDDYFFVVSSPQSIDTETAYSLGVDVNASDFEDFHDTSAFEPNNTEEEAKKIEVGESIKSFIHKGDIDFYTIKFKKNLSFTPPQLPFN